LKKTTLLSGLLLIFLVFGTSFVLFNSNSINCDLMKEEDNLNLKSSDLQSITFNLFAENGVSFDTSDLRLCWGSIGNGLKFGELVYVDISDDELWIFDMILWTYIYYEDNVYLSGLTEYNITCEVGKLTINLNAHEIGHFTLDKLSDAQTPIYFDMQPNTSKEFILEYGWYNATWLNTEDDSTTLYNFNMDSNNKEITLNSIFCSINFILFAEGDNRLNESNFSLYIDGIKEDFGVLKLIPDFIEITVYENIFNVVVFNQTEYLSGDMEYNIISNVRKLTINLNTREIGYFTLTEQSTLNSINFMMNPYTSREFILGQSDYNVMWLNTEDNSTILYDFNMSSNREITLNTVFYNVNFTLSDQFLNELDVFDYSLYINNVEEDFGIIELNKENVLITVYDRFGIAGFNQTILLSGLSEYNIIVPIYKLKIENLACKIGNFTLKEKITQQTYNFSLDPGLSRIFKLRSANYMVIWLNGENLQIYEYNITLTSDFELVLNSIYYKVYFSIFNFDGLGLDDNLVRFYINGIRSNFGNIELNSINNDLLILDFFNNTIYNETVDLSDKTEWNIYVEMYNIEIKNAYNYAIDLMFERNGFTVNITVPAQFSLKYRFVLGVVYNITWYRSSDGSYIGDTEIEFTKENLIVSFGVVANVSSNILKTDNILSWIIFITIATIISTLGILFKYRKRLLLYFNKKFRRLDND